MTGEQKPYSGNHVIQYPTEYSLCLGCESCEMVCALVHDGATGPTHRRITVKRGALDSIIHSVLTCLQCDDHPCYEACPLKDEAMCIDEQGIVYVDESNCIGCGSCADACSQSPSRIILCTDEDGVKAKKCDMCRGRKEGPACVQYCPSLCLGLSDSPLPEGAKKEEVL